MYWPTTVTGEADDRYHRILDLRAFRNMIANGDIDAEGFVTIRSDKHETILRHAEIEDDVVKLFHEYKKAKVTQAIAR